MNKEQENQFKENIKEIARLELKNSFTDNLMETLNSAFIFKYIETLEKENKQLKDNWNKIEQIIENERMSHWASSPLFLTELLSKMQELEKGDSNE